MELLRDNMVDVFSWVLRTSVEASVLVVVILILKAVLRERMSVRWHAAVWLVVIAKMLLPWTPESPISLYNITQISGNIASDAAVSDSHLEIQHALVPEPTDRRRGAITGVEQPTVEDRIAAIEQARNPRSRVEFADLRLYLLPGLWLTGAVLMLGAVYISNRRFLAQVYKNRPVIDERILETQGNSE